jgi:ketosteroid isomerase-like protein
MTFIRIALCSWLVAVLAACSTAPTADRVSLERQVADTEIAFARTMADRDHAAFTRFLAEDTVFFSGPTPLRGKVAVAAWWKRFYESPKAPFSWKPDKVEVLDNGQLAMSTGPVFDDSGKAVASFTSVWRQESPGVWRIIFDKGCNCP